MMYNVYPYRRTLICKVVPATGLAVSAVGLLDTTSGQAAALPPYCSAMLQAVSPCQNKQNILHKQLSMAHTDEHAATTDKAHPGMLRVTLLA